MRRMSALTQDMMAKVRLACQVAEGVSIKMRTGKILNSKTDWDAPSLSFLLVGILYLDLQSQYLM